MWFDNESHGLSKNDIPSIPIDNFEGHSVPMFDLISMQGTTENCQYAELVEKPLNLEQNFTFPKGYVNDLLVLGERMCMLQLTFLALLERIFKMENFSLQ